MTVYTLLFLAGLALEIFGAFILSAEAIGLDRLIKWVKSLTRLREELSGKREPRDSILKPSAGRLLFAGIAALGSGIGIRSAIYASERIASLPTWILALGAAVVGGCLGVILLRGLLHVLLIVSSLLHSIEMRTRARTIGFLGFLLLFLGLVLQFAGTLGESIWFQERQLSNAADPQNQRMATLSRFGSPNYRSLEHRHFLMPKDVGTERRHFPIPKYVGTGLVPVRPHRADSHEGCPYNFSSQQMKLIKRIFAADCLPQDLEKRCFDLLNPNNQL